MGNNNSRSYEEYYKSMDDRPTNPGDVASMMDPYRVLGVSKTYTWDDLKDAYRRLSLQVHPDKGGSDELFNIVTTCFRT